MPKLQDLRKIKEVSLPSYPDSKLEIYDSLLVGNMRTFDFGITNPVENILQSIPKFIKSWNFVDENEQPLPITAENFGFFKQEDVEFLINTISNFREENKKKLNI